MDKNGKFRGHPKCKFATPAINEPNSSAASYYDDHYAKSTNIFCANPPIPTISTPSNALIGVINTSVNIYNIIFKKYDNINNNV